MSVARFGSDGVRADHVPTREDSAPMTRPPAHSMFVPAKPYAPEGAARRDATPAATVAAPAAIQGYARPADDSPLTMAAEAHRRRMFALPQAFALVGMDYRRAGINCLPQSADIERTIDQIVSAGGPAGYVSQADTNSNGVNRSGQGSL